MLRDWKYCYRVIAIAIMLFYGMNAVAEERAREAPLVYFLMDTERPLPVKSSEARAIDQAIDVLLKEKPGVRFFFQLTNVKVNIDNKDELIYNGKKEMEFVRRGFLDQYKLPEIPANNLQPRRLDEEFRLISSTLKEINHKGPVWLIAFHDMDWVDRKKQVSSVGRFLGDGWLSAPVSPLVREFLSQDNSSMKGIKVLIFLEQTGDLSIRRGKETFFAKMFGEEMLKGEMLYLGPLHPFPAGGIAPLAVGLMTSAILQGRLPPMAKVTPRSLSMLQINGPRQATETVDVYR